jgi:hypothetical protein
MVGAGLPDNIIEARTRVLVSQVHQEVRFPRRRKSRSARERNWGRLMALPEEDLTGLLFGARPIENSSVILAREDDLVLDESQYEEIA